MNVQTVVKQDVKPVRIEVIGKKQGFQLTPGDTIYIMDSWDDSYYYAVNTTELSVASIRNDVMVYPVDIKQINVEILL